MIEQGSERWRFSPTAQGLTYNPMPIVLAAMMYLVMRWPLVRLLSRLEHKSVAVR